MQQPIPVALPMPANVALPVASHPSVNISNDENIADSEDSDFEEPEDECSQSGFASEESLADHDGQWQDDQWQQQQQPGLEDDLPPALGLRKQVQITQSGL